MLPSNQTHTLPGFDRITFNAAMMGGRACIRGMRITVSVVLKLLASRMTVPQILDDYPDLEIEDIAEVMRYAAWLADEQVAFIDNPSLVPA